MRDYGRKIRLTIFRVGVSGVDKYELFAVGHYFSEWPEGMAFSDFMNALASSDDIRDCWPAVEYEGIPNEVMAELIKSMISCLRVTFK